MQTSAYNSNSSSTNGQQLLNSKEAGTGVWIAFSCALLSLYVVTYDEPLQVNLTKASKQNLQKYTR